MPLEETYENKSMWYPAYFLYIIFKTFCDWNCQYRIWNTTFIGIIIIHRFIEHLLHACHCWNSVYMLFHLIFKNLWSPIIISILLMMKLGQKVTQIVIEVGFESRQLKSTTCTFNYVRILSQPHHLPVLWLWSSHINILSLSSITEEWK